MFHWIPSFQQTQSFHSNQKLSIRTGLSQTLPSLGPETCTEMVTNPVSSVYRNSYIPFLLKSIRFGIDFSNFSRFISGYSHTKLKNAMLIYMLFHHKSVFFQICYLLITVIMHLSIYLYVLFVFHILFASDECCFLKFHSFGQVSKASSRPFNAAALARTVFGGTS